MWSSIVNDCLIGPYIFPLRLNAEVYTVFLRDILLGVLEYIPLVVRQRMFQQDGASATLHKVFVNTLPDVP